MLFSFSPSWNRLVSNCCSFISYQLAKPGNVNLPIYNITGQLVRVLDDGKKLANPYSFIWDATRFASGIYFIKLSVKDHTAVRKMLLVKQSLANHLLNRTLKL